MCDIAAHGSRPWAIVFSKLDCIFSAADHTEDSKQLECKFPGLAGTESLTAVEPIESIV